MITATISGRIGKDAETREAGATMVTAFSIASTHKQKGKDDLTMWVDCSIWGDRGTKLREYLKKGGFVVASGKLFTHEHNGKTYLKLDVSELDLGPKTAPKEPKSDTNGSPADDDRMPF